jgi:hypothetical protein
MTRDGQATIDEFVAAWQGRNLSERQVAQTHFIQLCKVLGVPAPFDERAQDQSYLFDAVTAAAGSRAYAALRKPHGERAEAGLWGPVERLEQGEPGRSEQASLDDVIRVVAGKPTHGFADVWKKNCFCWEYKRQGKHPDLQAALAQLRLYAPSLGNPPLLIVSDIDSYEIHTNFTNYPTVTYRFSLQELADPSDVWSTRHGISPLNLLRAAFQPDSVERVFKPSKTLNAITEEYARKVADLADSLEPAQTEDGKPVSRQEVAHFLMQIVFGMFAEDIGLLPNDQMTRLLRQGNTDPKGFTRKIRSLFAAMEAGGDFGEETIQWFNGGLFKNVMQQRIPKLTAGQLGVFVTVGDDDWSAIEPSILGTLFERALNTQKRSQRGAHYTSREDIMLIVEPVILAPLREQWMHVQKDVMDLVARRDRSKGKSAFESLHKKIVERIRSFADKLADVIILDPACGSGNFLYVAIQCLLDLEREVIAFARRDEVNVKLTPKVSPKQLRGIEVDDYAAELARISIWIGFLKWKHVNAMVDAKRPILDSLDTIENRDAILDRSKKLPTPAKWPEADYIVGNPPFLYSKKFRSRGLDDAYLSELWQAYDLPRTSDLCCYWFERARLMLQKHPGRRVGLLATQSIRGGENRVVLDRIKKTGDIFMAWSDREWTLDGAAVQVSMIGFDDGSEPVKMLDGAVVDRIHAELTSDTATRDAPTLPENAGFSFMGVTPSGKFEIDAETAAKWLADRNVKGRENRDVLRRWFNAIDLLRRDSGTWIVDFGTEIDKSHAVQYEAPFEHVERVVAPARGNYRTGKRGFWVFERPRPEMRAALAPLPRYLATALVAKHRIFRWLVSDVLPANLVIVFARSDDYFFGVLHSAVHEVWSLRQGTQLEDRPRYTPTSTFETFPLPWSPGKEPTDPKAKHHKLWCDISVAARELDALREQWLNPAHLIAKIESKVDVNYRDQLAALPDDLRASVRQSAIMALAASEPTELKQLTLTNLYNKRPAWLRLAHEKLDRAVMSAYAAVDPQGEWDSGWATTYEPFGAGEITIRKKGTTANPADTIEVVRRKEATLTARKEVDAKILTNLLRLNHRRSRA